MSKLKRAQKYIGKKIKDPYAKFVFLVKSVAFKNEYQDGFYFKGRWLEEDGALHSQKESFKEEIKELQEELNETLLDEDLILKEIEIHRNSWISC